MVTKPDLKGRCFLGVKERGKGGGWRRDVVKKEMTLSVQVALHNWLGSP
jgi:hypothetical protein